MDETFVHHTMQSTRGTTVHDGAPALSASETETDTDSTITFVPKKYANSRTYSISNDSKPRVSQSPARASPPRPAKADDEHASPPTLPHQGSYHPDLQMDFYGVLSDDTDGGYDTPEGAKTRPTGQTITESELLRRRRLLDSHIFNE